MIRTRNRTIRRNAKQNKENKCIARKNDLKQCTRNKMPDSNFCKTHTKKYNKGTLVNATINDPIPDKTENYNSALVNIDLLKNASFYQNNECVIYTKIIKIDKHIYLLEINDEKDKLLVFKRKKNENSEDGDNIDIIGHVNANDKEYNIEFLDDNLDFDEDDVNSDSSDE